MKSERRHELQHNDLAEWAVRTYESVLPYRISILGVTLLLIVGVVAWEIWHGHSESQAFEAWNAVEIPQAVFQYPMAQMNPVYVYPAYADQMEKDSEAYAGTPAGDWARVLTADTCLFLGQSELLVNKEAAATHLSQAAVRYEKTIAASASSLARERAMFGRARILESVGKLPEATAAFQDLFKEFPQVARTKRLPTSGSNSSADRIPRSFTRPSPNSGRSPRRKRERSPRLARKRRRSRRLAQEAKRRT